MEKSGEYLESSIEVINRLIIEEKSKNSSRSPYKLFELCFLLVKSHLQYAAILSHLIDHEKALKQAQLSKEKVKDCAKMMKQISVTGSKQWHQSGLGVMLEKFIFEITNRDPTSPGSKRTEPSMSLFDKRNKSTPSIYASSSPNETKTESIGEHQTSGIIFWKHNQKNNEKYLKQELAKRYGESFKGKKMNTDWLQLFNIGNIMHVTPVIYRELLHEDIDQNIILTEDRLIELVLVYSCCLFSIATENRFICHKELDTDKATTELSGPANAVAKNYQLLQNDNFKQS